MMENILDTLIAAHNKAEAYRSENNTNRYPKEFKKVVIDAYKQGVQLAQLHKLTGMSLATLNSWIQAKQNKPDEMIPIEWARPKKLNPARIIMPSGITLELPLDSLTEEVFSWMVKGS